MAAVTSLGNTFNTTSGTHTVTATPAVNDLIVIIVANTGSTASVAPTDNQSGTYTKINSALKNTSADLLEIYVRTALIPAATSTIFTHAPGTTTGGGLAVYKITGMSFAGLQAIRQSAVQANQSSGGTPTPVFTNAPLSANPIIGAVFNATNAATMTPRSSPSYTEDLDTGYATPTTGFESMHINSGETGTSLAWGGTSGSAFCDVVIELALKPSELFSTYLFGDANLVSYYRLESTADAKGTNTLTNNNSVVFDAALFNNGADLGTANTTKYLNSANNLGIAGNGSISISFWVKMNTEISTAIAEVFVHHASQTGLNAYFQVYYDFFGANRELFIDNNGTGAAYTLTMGTTNRYHIVIVRDSANSNKAILYVNGVAVASNIAQGANGQSHDDFRIGTDESGDFASIQADDVAVFSRALTAQEVSDIYSGTTSRTITGLSRITAVTTKTITALSRITVTTSKTQTGLSRIQQVVSKTITGISRITHTTLQTITGKSRITATTLKTITGLSRITVTTTQTQQGKARIQQSVNQTIQGIARITAITTKTILGIARITATTTQTQLGKARLQKTVSQTITALSKISGVTIQTITGKAQITATTLQIVTALSRITATTTRTITALSRISITTSQTTTGKSRVTGTVLKTMTAITRITATVLRLQTGLARITATTTKTMTGIGNILATTLQIQTGKAKILTSSITTQRTQTGVARILSTVSKPSPKFVFVSGMPAIKLSATQYLML